MTNIMSGARVAKKVVRFPNCHECPVASGLGNLTNLNQLNEQSAVRFKDSQFQLVDVIYQILVPLEN